MIRKVLYITLFLSVGFTFGQELKENPTVVYTTQKISNLPYDPLRPSKAAFYSAVLPGLGQAYNRRYWKIPIVYGALASSIYYYSTNNTEYKRYRTAFIQRSNGETDEFQNVFSTNGLENAQSILKRNRDASLLSFVGIYALQILEASIDAHLLQFNVSDDITFDPTLIRDQNNQQNYVGLSVNLKF